MAFLFLMWSTASKFFWPLRRTRPVNPQPLGPFDNEGKVGWLEDRAALGRLQKGTPRKIHRHRPYASTLQRTSGASR